MGKKKAPPLWGGARYYVRKRLLAFDFKIVFDRKSAGHAVSTNARDILIACVGHHTLKPHMAVLHNNVNRGQRLESVTGGQHVVTVNRSESRSSDTVVVRR